MEIKMKLTNLFARITGIALTTVLAVFCTVAEADAQTVISNDVLSATTLVVNKERSSTNCTGKSCHAKKRMFAPIPVICPADIGKTCTFHVSLDAKVEISFVDDGFYQFLVDDAVPFPGPTLEGGYYRFVRFQQTNSIGPTRLSYPASLVATVTNTNSQNHTIVVSIACQDEDGDGCTATVYHSTMRVDVFQP
jgi:hypothetical protein